IRPSNSPWCSRLVPVQKPDSTLRLCVDYRQLNSHTIKDNYPLPRIDDIIDSLSKASIFSVLDATSGFYQIALNEKDIEKTAFCYKNGLYEFVRMPFGLCNAPGTFQRAMDTIFKKDIHKHVIPYLDDIIIFSKDLESHKSHLDSVLRKIHSAGLVLNKKKCRFFQQEIKILGNLISKGRVRPDPHKVEAIKNYKLPNNIKELRSFLGLCNYTREYIINYAEIALPLFSLLKGETKRSTRQINWDEIKKKAFDKLKQCICDITYRSQPDPENEFILTTDASQHAIGAILSQKNKQGSEEIIYTFSKGLDKAQMNYSVTDKELLAVIKGLEFFRSYLIGKPFVLKTDHKALEYLWSAKNMNSRMLRWSLKIQDYKFKIEYLKGDDNYADGLSRFCPVNAITTGSYSNENKFMILKNYHIASGHGSPDTMKFLLKEKYKWDKIFNDVDKYCESCQTCLKSGGPKVNTKNKIITTQRPNQLWECDLIGRIKCKDGENKFIFVAIDHYSKWVEACILERKTAEYTSLAIKKLILDKHGTPESILSDNGLEFCNSSISQICRTYGIDWITNSPGHHQTVGCVERTNQTLFNKLRKLCNYDIEQWEGKLKDAVFATNISFHRALGTSPYVFKFGKHPTLEIDKKFNIKEVKKDTRSLRQKRDEKFPNYAKQNIEKGKVSCENNFSIGEHVLIYKNTPNDKIGSNWRAGYKIKERVHQDSYIVSDGNSTLRLNKMHLKRDPSLRG
ncbi:MAG: reverse transcriptase domain-containing protein, partial [Aeromonas sp.]